MKGCILWLIFFELILSSPLCQPDSNNCLICNNFTNLCIKCKNNEVYIPDENGGCLGKQKCEEGKNYCEECNSEKIFCSKCSKGLFPDDNGGCSYTNNCEISYFGECLSCKEGFALIGESEGILKICKSLDLDDFKNCKEIDYSTGFCKICEDDYYMNSKDKKCINIEHCSISLYGKCISCDLDYYLDYKDEQKCKLSSQNKKFLHCKEIEDSENCSKCEENYYFDKNNKCVDTKYCSESADFKCSKCIEEYYITTDKKCVTTDNCFIGDGESGICMFCSNNFYLDINEGKCHSNQDDDDLKYCSHFKDKCFMCEKPSDLGEDGKCSNTTNCAESEYGICQKCSENYFLSSEHRCTNIKHCIYTNDDYSCKECEDGYYFQKSISECKKAEGHLKNCKVTEYYSSNTCSECKRDFYLSTKDNLCIDNNEEGPFYKCAKTSEDGTECIQCIENYYLGSEDKICSAIENCAISENNNCIECEEDFCLNLKSGKCINNAFIEKENEKACYKCERTNKEGTECEKCVANYTLEKNGLCIDTLHCQEEKDGACIKCQKTEYPPLSYCLNNEVGCAENYFSENCLRCDNYLNFDNCTKCADGYELKESGFYEGQFYCDEIQ